MTDGIRSREINSYHQELERIKTFDELIAFMRDLEQGHTNKKGELFDKESIEGYILIINDLRGRVNAEHPIDDFQVELAEIGKFNGSMPDVVRGLFATGEK